MPVNINAKPDDDLANDLIEILDCNIYFSNKNLVYHKDDLLQALCKYLVARDHKILNHGIKVGQSKPIVKLRHVIDYQGDQFVLSRVDNYPGEKLKLEYTIIMQPLRKELI